MTVPRYTHKKQYPQCLDKLEKAKYMGEMFTLKNDEFRGGSSLKSDRIIFGGAAGDPERRSRELTGGVRGHAPPENFEN